MKLRNIFLATLAVCTLASCSKDNDDTPSGPVQPVDASVSFAVASDALTKAAGAAGTLGEGDTEANEKIVHELTALIFDANDKLVGRKDTVHQSGDVSIDRIEHITIKVTPADGQNGASKEVFNVVLVANAKDKLAGVTDKTGLGTVVTNDITAYTLARVKAGTCLPMVGSTAFTGVQPLGDNHTENWVGNSGLVTSDSSPITLTRLVARVQLEKVSINFAGGDYANASFDLTKVFLANVASTSPFKLLGEEENASALWKGFQSDSFAVKQQLIVPANGNNVKTELLSEVKVLSDQMKGNGYTFGSEDKPVFYAFAYNGTQKASETATTPYETRLILEGLFKRTASAPAELRHFHVVLNKENVNKVLPNYIYKITVNITGEGSPNEDDILLNAHISATIDVAPWNVINQDEDDKN